MALILGVKAPRISTEPLRELGPATSLGPECVRFAASVLGVAFDPWQEEFLLRALETRPDGSFRYRTVLLLVSRQNGKSLMATALILFLMYTGRAKTTLGVAQSLSLAKEIWQSTLTWAQEACHETRSEIAGVKYQNGQESFTLTNGCRYKVAAANRSAGRGLSIDFLFIDELREQRSWDAWAALGATTSARPNSLTLATTNAGSDESVVLNSLRESALSGRDETLGLFEWSSPDDADIDDIEGWAQANPSLGHGRLTLEALKSARSMDPPGVFRTERLCQRVTSLDSAVDINGWRDAADPAFSLGGFRDRIHAAVDVSYDGGHVALVAATALANGRFGVETIAGWWSTDAARDELPEILAKLKPLSLTWIPNGPAAALSPVLYSQPNLRELSGLDVTSACMSFADLVAAGRVTHSNDRLLDAQIASASRLRTGDGFKFTRRGAGHCDALYAASAALFVAATTPEPKPRRKPVMI